MEDLTRPFLGGLVLLVGIIWLGSALGGFVFALAGLAIIGLGIWMLVTPLRAYYRASCTYYAITDRRVLIITAGRQFLAHAVYGHDITDFRRIDGPDGGGSIQLTRTTKQTADGSVASVTFDDGLWQIYDLPEAEAAIKSLMKTS